MNLKNNLAILICLVALCLTFSTFGAFVVFLSTHQPLNMSYFKKTEVQEGSVVDMMLTNTALLSLFMIQHTLQKGQKVKNFFATKGLIAYERVSYNVGTCLTLLILIYFWQPVKSWTFWDVSSSNYDAYRWIFMVVHLISWLLIYSGCYIMDIGELLGLKQVICSIQGQKDPLTPKSDDLRRLYKGMRHPCFSPFIVILFVHPVMQLDRFLFAYCLLCYILLSSRMDENDYVYQKRQFVRKQLDLNASWS